MDDRTWTDLNMDHAGWGGDWYFNEYCGDGGCTFGVIIIDFEEVEVYTSKAPRSFEIAINTAPFADSSDTSIEHITFDYYGPEIGAGESTGLVVGAENRDGSSAATIGPVDTLPSSAGYIVNFGDPLPGGTVTIDYNVLGKKICPSSLTALMWSDIVAGTTKIVTPLSVTP